MARDVVIPGTIHTTDRDRIYDFRCKCGRAGVRRARTRLVKVTCRDCGADVEWWQSRPEVPFAKPELSPELATIPPAIIDEIRADRWTHLSRIAVVGPDAGAVEGNEPIASIASAGGRPRPQCSTAAIREAAKIEISEGETREQLTLGEMFAAKPEGGGGI